VDCIKGTHTKRKRNGLH